MIVEGIVAASDAIARERGWECIGAELSPAGRITVRFALPNDRYGSLRLDEFAIRQCLLDVDTVLRSKPRGRWGGPER